MPHTILGLDIGGANLKAATPDKRAVAVPFPLWKHPEKLPAALSELIAQFGEVKEFAVTMTGELCDCFETKRQGVEAIVTAVMNAAHCWPVRVWGTDGTFHTTAEAKERWETVAAANWHALATYCGQLTSIHDSLLIDVGSTTTDIIPLTSGVPYTYGTTDAERLQFSELVYTGVKRTPVCAVVNDRVCAELFADMGDVYLVLGTRRESPNTTDTADGRPETIPFALSRLARMLGGDRQTISDDDLFRFATRCHQRQRYIIAAGIREVLGGQQQPLDIRTVILSGSGEFLAEQAWQQARPEASANLVSLTDRLGPAVAECAPAYAVSVLAQERPL